MSHARPCPWHYLQRTAHDQLRCPPSPQTDKAASSPKRAGLSLALAWVGSARLINAINLLQRNTVDVAKAEHPHAGETGTLSHSASCPLRFPHTCPQNLFTRLSTGGATIFTLRQLDSRTTRTGVATRGTAQSRTLRAGKWYIQLSLRGRLCRGSAETRQHFGKN